MDERPELPDPTERIDESMDLRKFALVGDKKWWETSDKPAAFVASSIFIFIGLCFIAAGVAVIRLAFS